VTTRDAFIAAVRHRLRNGIPANPIRPIPDVTNEPIAYTLDLTDLVAHFAEAITKVDAELIAFGDEPISGVVRRALDLVDPGLVAVSNDPECAEVEVAVRDAGIALADSSDIDALAQADLGITGAVAGIALTGSIVVDSRRAGGRLVSLLPKTHLALLPTNRVVAQPGDVLRNISTWFPEGLPSNMVFITGPSRSADIELQITKGVHGPQRLLIALR
jgi:L-lactate dehydrogenase complex protein LldG